MAVAPVLPRLQPPAAESALDDAGMHSVAWTEHHQKVTDALATFQTRAGTVAGDDAAAGDIGEYLTATASGIALTTSTMADIVTLPLTAGDWDVWGMVAFTPAPTTGPRLVFCSVGPASLTSGVFSTSLPATFTTGQNLAIGTGGVERFSLAAAGNAYLVGLSTFITSTMTAGGVISARRVR